MVLTCLPVIYKDFCAENVPDFFFPLSAFHALLQHATCFLHNIFFGALPTPLPNPDASHQFRIDVAVHHGRKATWNGWFRQPPHCIHSTCVNQDPFFLNPFLDAEDSLGVVHMNVNIPPTPPNPRRDVACACVASSHEREHPPHPTQPKTWRSMRVCRKFTWTWTSPPPHPTQDVT